jgi:hypothetical protein
MSPDDEYHLARQLCASLREINVSKRDRSPRGVCTGRRKKVAGQGKPTCVTELSPHESGQINITQTGHSLFCSENSGAC